VRKILLTNNVQRKQEIEGIREKAIGNTRVKKILLTKNLQKERGFWKGLVFSVPKSLSLGK
jgi:hypothetical protein